MQNRMYGLPACKTRPSLSCPQEITTTEKNQEARGNAKQGNKQEKKNQNFHKASFPSVLNTNLSINIILHKPG